MEVKMIQRKYKKSMIYIRKRKLYLAIVFFCILCTGCSIVEEKDKNKINENVVNTEESSLKRWRETLDTPEEVSYIAEAVRGIEVVKNGETIFAVSYEPRIYKNTYECWDISVPYESMVTVDTEYLYQYFKLLEKLQIDRKEYIPESENKKELQNYIFVAYYQEQTLEEPGLAEPDSGVIYQIGSLDSNNHFQVSIEGSQQTWAVPETLIKEIYEISPFDCILKVTNLINLETVSQILVETGEKSIVFSVKDAQYQVDNQEIKKEDFLDLYAKMMGIYIQKEIPLNSSKKYQIQDAILTLTFLRNIESAPAIIQKYEKYNEKYCTVSINDKKFFLVDRQEVEKLKKTLCSIAI